MSQLIDVVKRGGKRPSERFDRDKLHASVRAACLSVRSPYGEAETTSESVCDYVVLWCAKKQEVTSNDLRRIATERLARMHPDAAYIYKHHRLVL